MKVLLTGSSGFLGWHTRARLKALTSHEVRVVGRPEWSDLAQHAVGVDAIIHVAGINRGPDDQIERENIQLAHDVANAARASGSVARIVFANSIHAGSDTPYGLGKGVASEVLDKSAGELGLDYVDVRLPNLFGEHGRPNYNSFVATFVRAVIDGEAPRIADREVGLLHAQAGAQSLINALATPDKRIEPAPRLTTVKGVLDTLSRFNALYDCGGDIPPLLSEFDIDLFNTLRAARFPTHYPIALRPRIDHRGSLVEIVRVHGGQGQTFVSTTRPGITRGEHFHLRKIERFVVLSGTAQISLRRLFSNQIISLHVTGREPVIMDMPTMWVHNITNRGDNDLTTLFWANQLFDRDAPDTFPEPVNAMRCSVDNASEPTPLPSSAPDLP